MASVAPADMQSAFGPAPPPAPAPAGSGNVPDPLPLPPWKGAARYAPVEGYQTSSGFRDAPEGSLHWYEGTRVDLYA